MKLFMLLGLLGLTGCATMVSTHGDSKSAYAPINESVDRGGVITCRSRRSRENAYKKMYIFCGGAYEITKEEIVQHVHGYGTSVPGYGINGRPQTQYTESTDTSDETYLTFKCKG